MTLYSDGTKVREETPDAPPPDMPESIDLKITDYCEAACPFCHESSTKRGKHADPEFVHRIMHLETHGLLEVAIGGGDPLSHPDLEYIFWSNCGPAKNLTINFQNVWGIEDEAERSRRLRWLLDKIGNKDIHGLGISVGDEGRYEYTRASFAVVADLPNTVIHLIAGVHNPDIVRDYNKVLVLGFKNFGFGRKYLSDEVRNRIAEWRYRMPGLIVSSQRAGRIVSFDNLAIEQLGLRSYMKAEAWDKFYMGDDGTRTMYVDAVRQEYAKSSTSPRKPCGEMTLKEMFADVRGSLSPTTV